MNWNEAENIILKKIYPGVHIDTASPYRYVISGPYYNCKTYDYNNDMGFRISIGNSNRLDIPLSMLETLFNASVANNRIYNSSVFQQFFKLQSTRHPCHVYVVGKLFKTAEIAVEEGIRNYRIL